MKEPDKISTTDHWIYGPCNFDTDIEGIEYLIDKEKYNNSACIRRYYDNDKDQYFNTNEDLDGQDLKKECLIKIELIME